MKRPAFYIGRCPGCANIVAGCVVSQGRLEHTADDVREFIIDGLTIEPLFAGPVNLQECTCEANAPHPAIEAWEDHLNDEAAP